MILQKEKKDNPDFRMTSQRQVIMDEFAKSKTHLSADEVYRKVRRRLPRVSLGTVYRNLELLSGHGIIRKVEYAGKQKLFDGDMSNHYHLKCTQCGILVDIPVEKVFIDFKALEQQDDFCITGHDLKIFGVCDTCRKST
jgi:Fur family ferric uptake transcriptional regulator